MRSFGRLRGTYHSTVRVGSIPNPFYDLVPIPSHSIIAILDLYSFYISGGPILRTETRLLTS